LDAEAMLRVMMGMSRAENAKHVTDMKRYENIPGAEQDPVGEIFHA